MIDHWNKLQEQILCFLKSSNGNYWSTWNWVRWCFLMLNWVAAPLRWPCPVNSLVYPKTKELFNLPADFCFTEEIKQPVNSDLHTEKTTKKFKCRHNFCVIPDFKLNMQTCWGSIRLIQAQSTSGEISDEFKKSFELMLLAIDLNYC